MFTRTALFLLTELQISRDTPLFRLVLHIHLVFTAHPANRGPEKRDKNKHWWLCSNRQCLGYVKTKWLLTAAVCFVRLLWWSPVGFVCPIWTVPYATVRSHHQLLKHIFKHTSEKILMKNTFSHWLVSVITPQGALQHFHQRHQMVSDPAIFS